MTDALATSNRLSIDLSLELERQLESDSLPGSPPAKNVYNRTSLDPHVLAHIVTQLRDSLTHITRERDDLVHQLAESHTREAEFKDSLALWSERCAKLEKDFEEARKKSQDDDEAISMLRSKVEESRRGLMRLQSERNAETKRLTLDLSHHRTSSISGPRSSHRSSFTPLTGSGHHGPPSSFRRPSSTVSESDPGFVDFVANLPGSPTQTLSFNENAEGSSSQVNRRRSMLGALNRSSGSLTEGRVSPSPEVEMIKRELAAAKTELEETRHDLTEANEAREASESCVKALRDFISQLGAGDTPGQGENVRLPPLPTDSHVKDIEPVPKPQKGSGWGGLKLWRVDTGTTTPTAANTTISPTSRLPMDSYRIMGSDRDGASPSTAVPLRNKFGAFFTRGSSISSIAHPPPHSHQDEPIANGSDVSSLTEMSEPISPAAEKAQTVFVREAVEETAGEAGNNTRGVGYTQEGVGNGDALKSVPL